MTMRKTWLIISREYLSRVKKKSFIILTLLIPFLIAAMLALEIFLAMGGNKKTQHIAVVDESGLFSGQIHNGQELYFTDLTGSDTLDIVHRYGALGYDGLLYIPVIELANPAGFIYYAPQQLGMGPYQYITGQLDKAIENRRMMALGVNAAQLKRLHSDVDLIQPGAGTGLRSHPHATAAATAAGYVLGLMTYLILLFYGMQVMRGVAEEKVNRIAEVLVSSVKPFQLMIGKVVGIAAVGLTQFGIWIILGGLALVTLGPSVPGAMHVGAQGYPGSAAPAGIAAIIGTLPLAKLLGCFLFYFLGGYLLYAALFAAVGSAVDQDMTESQALTVPITLPLVISFFIMFNTIQQPSSPLSVFASLFPLSSPLVMVARIPFGVPVWQLLVSMVLLIGAVVFMIWIAGRIYRTGILLYGKKITLKELARWAWRKN